MRTPHARDELRDMLYRRLRQYAVTEVCDKGSASGRVKQSVDFARHHGAARQQQDWVKVALQRHMGPKTFNSRANRHSRVNANSVNSRFRHVTHVAFDRRATRKAYDL